MPIYEYQCQACGELTEALQKISDPPLTVCPHCGAAELRKKVSAAAFRLKGGGWYETDFKKSGRKNVAGEGKDGGGDSGAKEGGAGQGKQAESAATSEKKTSGTEAKTSSKGDAAG